MLYRTITAASRGGGGAIPRIFSHSASVKINSAKFSQRYAWPLWQASRNLSAAAAQQKLDKLPMNVYFGSQSGNAQLLAHLLAQEAEQQDMQATAIDLSDFDPKDFSTGEHINVLIMSTFGEGEPTDNAKKCAVVTCPVSHAQPV